MLRPQGVIPGCPPAHIGGTLKCDNRTVRSGQYRGKANTLRALDASYVAGFLDGDGSIHFQLVRQKEYRFGYYIRASMSFSQSTSARGGLEAIQPYVIFKKEHVRRALSLLPRLDRLRDPNEFLQLAREVDAFATLNYSKSKRISAADVEQYLLSKGVLCPCNDFLALLERGDGVKKDQVITDA